MYSKKEDLFMGQFSTRTRLLLVMLTVVVTIAAAALIPARGAPNQSNAQGPGSITHIAGSFGEDGLNYDTYEIISPSGLVCVAITSDPNGGSTGGSVGIDCEKK